MLCNLCAKDVSSVLIIVDVGIGIKVEIVVVVVVVNVGIADGETGGIEGVVDVAPENGCEGGISYLVIERSWYSLQ